MGEHLECHSKVSLSLGCGDQEGFWAGSGIVILRMRKTGGAECLVLNLEEKALAGENGWGRRDTFTVED